MKKTLSILLALALMLSLLPAAVLAFDIDLDPDVVDGPLVPAINNLQALGVIEGYEDGSFKSENTATRAELFKTTAVAVCGGPDIPVCADVFKDDNGHWSEGYNNYLASLKIIDGTGGGNVSPDVLTSIGDAATVYLRALGQTDLSVNGGESGDYSAANYLSAAKKLGITLDIDGALQAGDPAKRGDMALMLNAALTKEIVAVDKDGKTEGTGQKLISKIAASVKGVEVTPAELSKGHIVDLRGYVFQNIDVYKNADQKIVYVEKSNSTVYTGSAAANKNSGSGVITVTMADGATKNITLPVSDVPAYYNGAATTVTEAKLESSGAEMTFVVGDSGLKGVSFEEYAPPVQVTQGYVSGKTNFSGFKLPVKDGKVNLDKITVTGAADALEDIEKDDVIECAKAADGSAIKFVVTRDTIHGKVTKLDGDKYYISGEAYKLNGAQGVEIGSDGVFYLDMKGNVAFFRAGEVKTAYGVILGFAGGKTDAKGIVNYPKVRIADMNGMSSIYELAAEPDGKGGYIAPKGVSLTLGDDSVLKPTVTAELSTITSSGNSFCRYTLDKNGRVSAIEAAPLVSAAMRTDSKEFLAGDGTAILCHTGNSEYKPVKAAELSKDEISLQYCGAGKGWDVVFVGPAALPAPTELEYGLLTDFRGSYTADGQTYSIGLLDPAGNSLELTTAAGAKVSVDMYSKNKVVEYEGDKSAAPFSGQVIQGARLGSATSTYITLSGSDKRLYLAEGYTVYMCDRSGAPSVGDIADVKFHADDTPMDLYLLNDEVRFIVIDPVYYQPVIIIPPATTTHYGLALEYGNGEDAGTYFISFSGGTTITFNSDLLPDGIPESTYPVVKYTMQGGAVTSVTELEGIEVVLEGNTVIIPDQAPQDIGSDVLLFEDGSSVEAFSPGHGFYTAYYDGAALVAVCKWTPVD